MTKKISLTSLLLSVVLLIVLALAPSVFAEDGVQAEDDNRNTSLSETFEQQKEKKIEEYKKQLEQKREDAKQKAEEAVEVAKNKVEAKTKEVREKNCQARKEALGNKIKATSEAAKRHYDKITGFNQKIDEFVTNKSLVVANYDALQAAVTDKAAIADSAVTALSEFEQQVDCSNIDEATAAVLAYKELLTDARESLKAYRSATKDLLVAVKTAAEAAETQSTETEGAN
jgi:hypothetical protein